MNPLALRDTIDRFIAGRKGPETHKRKTQNAQAEIFSEQVVVRRVFRRPYNKTLYCARGSIG